MAELILERILVAIDFSQQSNTALEQAVLAARQGKAELVLLWVSGEASPVPAGGEVYDVPGIDELLAATRSEATARLEVLKDRVKSQGIAVSTRIESGHPDEVIVRVAEEIGAALLFIGTRGLTGLKRFLLGSVAERVVRTATTNVLVARDQPKAFERVLVATDFSVAAERAIQVARVLAGPHASIDIVHAWQYPVGTRGLTTPEPKEGPMGELHDEIVSRVARLGAALVQRYGTSSQTLRFVHEYGPACEIIQARLESQPYDLVAMGTHGYRGFQRFLLGSVAEATVRHAPCSVLIAHPGHTKEHA